MVKKKAADPMTENTLSFLSDRCELKSSFSGARNNFWNHMISFSYLSVVGRNCLQKHSEATLTDEDAYAVELDIHFNFYSDL